MLLYIIDLLCRIRQRKEGQFIDLDTMDITDEAGENLSEDLNVYGSDEAIDAFCDLIDEHGYSSDVFERVANGGYWAPLYNYQKDAVAYLETLRKRELQGAILSFYMGMGKTITSLSMVESSCIDKTLVICEKSNISNWINQIKKHFPGVFNVIVLHRDFIKNPKTVDIEPYDIIITTYDFASRLWNKDVQCFVVKTPKIGGSTAVKGVHSERVIEEHNKIAKDDDDVPTWRKHKVVKNRDLDNSPGPLFNIKWDMIIADEVTKFANYNTKTSIALASLVSEYYLILSGTPMINYSDDLYSSFRFMGLEIAPREFKHDLFAIRRLNDFIYKKSYDDDDVDITLPELNENLIRIALSPIEKKGLTAIEEELKNQYGLFKSRAATYSAPLKMFTHMRMYLDSPHILATGKSDLTYLEKDDIKDMLHDEEFRSSKTAAIIDQIKDMPDKKIIVFSNYVKYLNELKLFVEDDIPDIRTALLSGETKDRDALVQEMNTGNLDILFTQIKVGSNGLNIQGADVIFISEPAFNLATEKQAIARAHRIGRTGAVDVYRFIVDDSFEYQVLQIQNRKEEDKTKFMGGENEVKERLTTQIMDWVYRK